MTRGRVEIHGTGPGFLIVRISYQHLWFLADDQKRRR